MLTSVQKEILQTLINLYHSSNGGIIKSDDIAEVMNRNSGTIRNQMVSLRSLDLVKSIQGPCGGYKPTIKTYQYLKISVKDEDYKVPIYTNGKKMKNISVAKIELTSVPQPRECEASIKVLGSIKALNLGDEIIIGPTPVNNLGITGTITGRDDTDNILLVDTKTIRSIPKINVGDIANGNIISLSLYCSVKDASKIFVERNIDGAPVIEKNKIIGIFTLTDLVNAIANDKEEKSVGELMSTDVVIVDKDLKIAKAIEIMLKKSISRLIIADKNQLLGMVTKTDIIETIMNLKEFPIITN